MMSLSSVSAKMKDLVGKAHQEIKTGRVFRRLGLPFPILACILPHSQ